jgi:hypothetical protein
MGYLRDIYGKRSNEFVRGVLAGILFCSDYFIHDADLKAIMSDVVNDVAESPEEFEINQICERGYIL